MVVQVVAAARARVARKTSVVGPRVKNDALTLRDLIIVVVERREGGGQGVGFGLVGFL